MCCLKRRVYNIYYPQPLPEEAEGKEEPHFTSPQGSLETREGTGGGGL